LKTINVGVSLNSTAAQRQASISSEDRRRKDYLNSILRQLPQHYRDGKDQHEMEIHRFQHLLTIAVSKAFPMFRVIHGHRRKREKLHSWLLTPESNIIDLFSGEFGVPCVFEEARIYPREDCFYPHIPHSQSLRLSGHLLEYDSRKMSILEDLTMILLELQKRR
jgi:hypothetical protein